ncbi:hypothetical protein N7492_000008 [Penicillium capsulatum]|uniref:GPI anchored protein n=1 Tax=Penicillium capsulatum TaxID=69766 RepID=A0A9W9LZK9_9EURO|nr:hypothetical protein N7492_000008 [Penicillium capsulatum]
MSVSRLFALVHCAGLVWSSMCTRPDATNTTVQDSEFIAQAQLPVRSHEAITFLLSARSVQGVRKMGFDEGEKFFFEDWRFIDDSSALLIPRSYPLEEAFHPSRRGWLKARDFKCPTDTHACTNIHRSDRCCGLGSTCELVKDTGSGEVGCCANGSICSGVVGSCQRGYTACSSALGGGCCIPGYECVPVSPLPTPQAESMFAQRGFYACSAIYHGGCCQTGRDCDTTSCPTTSSTTLTSNGVAVVVPVTADGDSPPPGRCAKGWFPCADTAGGGCCPTEYACGSSCTATAARTTVAKEQATTNSAARRNQGAVWGIGLLWMWVW